MNKKRILLVAILAAICLAAAGGVAVGARAALSTTDKMSLYYYCRTALGKDPKFCCETVGGAYTTWVDSSGTIHTECVFANSPNGNASNFAAASPPFAGSLSGATISVTQSGGQSGAGLYGVVQISETINGVIP